MNTPSPSFDDALVDRCCLYLLGEMPADEAARWEQQAMASDTMRSCLQQQAELIAALGSAYGDRPAATVPPQPAPPQPAPPQPAPPQPLVRTSICGWPAALAVALAASLLWVIALDRSAGPHDDPPSDAVQLAQAWAAARSVAEPPVDGKSVAAWDGEPGLDDAPLTALEPWRDVPARADGHSASIDTATIPVGPPEWLIVAVYASESDAEPAEEASGVAFE